MAIKSFSKARMRAATHITIMRNCLKYANILVSINSDQLRGLIAALAQRVDKEDSDYHVAQGSQYTQQITAADEMRDRSWGIISVVSRAFLQGYGTREQTAAAETITKLIGENKVVTTDQFVQETGEINEFVQKADAYVEAFSLLALDTVYANLKRGNNDVNDYIMKRQDERALLPAGALKDDRVATDAAYDAFVSFVDAFNIVMPSPAIGKFITEWNSYIDYMRVQILHDSATATDATAPDGSAEDATTTPDPAPAPDGDGDNGGAPGTQGGVTDF